MASSKLYFLHGIDTIACLIFFPYHRSILKSQGSTKHNTYTIIAQYESHMNSRGWAFITISGTSYIFIIDYINLINHDYACVWTSNMSINWYRMYIKLIIFWTMFYECSFALSTLYDYDEKKYLIQKCILIGNNPIYSI